MDYSSFYLESIESPDAFWTREAQAIDWQHPFETALHPTQPEFTNWFTGGQLNVCRC